jgi:hypothetical protein
MNRVLSPCCTNSGGLKQKLAIYAHLSLLSVIKGFLTCTEGYIIFKPE